MQVVLNGKKALVGGSSKGIGRAIARQLAKSGASVTLMARDRSAMKKLIEEFPSGPGQEHGFLVVDFSDFEEFKVTMTEFFSTNTVDILVNNTPGPKAGSVLEVDTSDYQDAFDTLFKSIVLTTELALPHMMKTRWGRIINITSVSVREPLGYLALSNTIRAAVVTWAKTLSREVGKFNITVNSILTGYFDTERLASLNKKKAERMGIAETEVRAHLADQVPLGRIGKPEEYGELVTFLASEKASYISGTSLPIDGGLLRSL